MSKSIFILVALISNIFADQQPSYGAPPAAPPQVKYGGPIVYTGEKPPIIHFPPPPEKTTAGDGYGSSGGKAPAIKYVPLPHHDLPVLIYTSDHQPPIHVVHTPRPEYQAQKKAYQEDGKIERPAPKQDIVPSPPPPSEPPKKPGKPVEKQFNLPPKNKRPATQPQGPQQPPPPPPPPSQVGAPSNETVQQEQIQPAQQQNFGQPTGQQNRQQNLPPPPPPPPPHPRGQPKHGQAPPPKKQKAPHKIPSAFGLLSQKARQSPFGQRPEQRHEYHRPEQNQEYQRQEQKQEFQRQEQKQDYPRPDRKQDYQRPEQKQENPRPDQKQDYYRPEQRQDPPRQEQKQDFYRPEQRQDLPRPEQKQDYFRQEQKQDYYRPEQRQDYFRPEQKPDQQQRYDSPLDYQPQRKEDSPFSKQNQEPTFKLEKNFGPLQPQPDLNVAEAKAAPLPPPPQPPQKNFRGSPKAPHKPEKGFFHLPDFNLGGGSSRKQDQEFSLFSRPDQKKTVGEFEPSQPIPGGPKEKAAEEKKEHSFFNLPELLSELLPDPSYLKASSKSDDVHQAPVKQAYSADAPRGIGTPKPVYVNAPPPPATVYINAPNPVFEVKNPEPPKYISNREDVIPPPPPPPPAPAKKVYQNDAPKPDYVEKKQDPAVVAPKVDVVEKEAQQKQSYDAPAPSYAPPKKPSYAPPKPTYKPKPTYQPKPKPVYNPPPTYAPAPPAPHIIYAGHPPIHIYQQPAVETLAAAAPVAPQQSYNPPPPPPPPQAYAAPKQSYQDNGPVYNEPRQSFEKSDNLPNVKSSLPPPPPPPPPKAPQKTQFSEPPQVSQAPQVQQPQEKVDQSPPKSDVIAPEELIPAKDKNFNKEQKNYAPKQEQNLSSGRGNLGAPKGPGIFGAQKKQEYVPPKQQKRGPPPKPSSFGPPGKPVGPPKPAPKAAPKSSPQPPPPAPYQPPAQSKQTYQEEAAPVYIPAPKAFHKPPIIIYQGVAPPVHVYEQPSGVNYNAQAKSSNVVELEEWNPSNGKLAQERSDSGVEANPAPVEVKADNKLQVQPEEIVNISQGSNQDTEAVVSAKVSVVTDVDAKGPVAKSKVTHKGTVEDIADN